MTLLTFYRTLIGADFKFQITGSYNLESVTWNP